MGSGVGEAMFMALLNYTVAGMTAPNIPKQKQPTITPPVEMPDPLAQDDAKKKSLIEQMQRSGRASTMLTDNSGKLGG